MLKTRRLLLAAVSGLVLLSGAPALSQEAPSDPWPQATSDIPADSNVRFGILPNGMRYAILRNATPPGQASLRLRIDAGSLMEDETQRGLAHFIEHMAFNGTTNIPENELLRILERLGLAFGADTNASTGFDQTQYRLDLPRTNDETVDTALRILREQASEALMTPEAIDEERGVIVGEERSGDTPQRRSLKARFALLAPGQRLADRLPIGDLETIRTAPRDRFVAFYEAYYRPSRATLLAVGDFDVEVMEGKIRAAFESWEPRAPDGPEPDLGTVAPREAETRILVEPGVQSTVQINWTRPPDLDPDTIAERRSSIVRNLGLAVLNRRLGEISRADNPPFIRASASASTLFDSLDIGTVSADFNPGGLQRAVEAMEQETRRLVQFGVTGAELQREIVDTRTALENAVAAAGTRTTPALANALLNATNNDRVFAHPRTNLEIFDSTVASLTPAEVDAAVREAFQGEGPLVLVITPEPIEGGEAALASVLQASQATPVTARAETAALEWPYSNFGPAAQPSQTREIPEIGATVVTFPNGTRLTVKPTDFRDEQILVSVETGIGELGLPTDRLDPQALASITFTAGGVGRLTLDELNRVLSGRIYSASFAIEGDAYRLNGATRPADLTLQMQVLAAYLTDPGLRPAPFERMKAQFPQIVAQQSATPAGAFGIQAYRLLASGDARQAWPTAETVAGWTNDQLKAGLLAGLGQGPIDVTVVGDVTVEDAIAAVGSTFGALPARPDAPTPSPEALTRRFPAGATDPVRLTHLGQAEQAMAYVAWPTTDAIGDRTEARQLSLLAAVMNLRAIERIREELAITYSPGVGSSSSDVFEGYGSIFASAEVTPENLSVFHAEMDAIAAALRDEPPTDDELNRARAPAVERLRRNQAGNEYWLNQLQDVDTDPAAVGEITGHIAELEAVTPATIQALAQRYLDPSKAWRASVVAESVP